MAKKLDTKTGRTNSGVGTPEYMAPEIVRNQSYTFTADWWSYGILLYEMIVGVPPFYNEDPEVMYELIKQGPLVFPSTSPISSEAEDIIKLFLDRNADRRLGKNGLNELKE